MQATTRELSQELTRIIACPYPASLITLADILSRADEQTVRTCIHHLPPCAVVRLASIVSGSLSLWSHSLRILHALCHSVDFRAILLIDNPGLLDALLNKANTSQRDFDEYAALCVNLLSRPLPEAVSLPASAQQFFLRLFDRAVQSPEVDTIKPIYACLNGACRGLLSLLSPEARHSFDKELCQILQSNTTGQNFMLLLWCFGIAILAEHPQDVGKKRNPTSSLARPTEWKTASGRKLFGSSSGLGKAINLTYLSVIWASKGDVGVSDTEAVEGIRIATRTMQLVDKDLRESWPNSTSITRNTSPKLLAKVMRRGIDPGVKLEALGFYAIIVGENNLPAEAIAQYEAALTDVKHLHTDTDCLRESLSVSLPMFAPHLRESTIRQLLAEILNISTSSGRPYELSNVSILVEEITSVAANCPALSSQLLSALSSDELQESIQNFLEASVVQSSGEKEGCGSSISCLRRELLSATVSMLLTCALTTRTTDHGVPQSLVIAFVSKQRQLGHFPSQCNHQKVSPKPTISLFEQECTPSTGVHRLDWRDHLKLDLERQGSYQQDAVIRSVALICEDLENRCNTVEEPLRREREKARGLTAQVSQLHEKVHSLETEAMDRQAYADGLEAQNANVEQEKDEMSTRLADLKMEYTHANREADETLRTAQEEFNARELQLSSIILTHEEELHSRGQRLEDMSTHLQALEDAVHEEQNEKMSLQELHATLQAKSATLEHELEIERETTAQHAEEIVQLKDLGNNLENRLSSTKKELEAITDQWNELQARNLELARTSEQTLRDLKARHENDIENTTSKANDAYNRLHRELQDALGDAQGLRAAYNDTTQELELERNTVNALETQVQRLTDACGKKDEELFELKTWKSRVLTSMGVPTDNPLPIRTNHQDDNHRKISQQHRRRKSSIKPQGLAPPQGTAEVPGITNTMEHVANASYGSSDASSRDGSTPKRPKPRPSFKIPSMQTSYGQNPHLASRSVSKQLSPRKRAALRAVSPNRRHTTVGFAIEENEEHDEETKGNRRGSLHFGEQASFDMDRYLDSTPITPGHVICGTGREPEEEFGEETTEL